MGSFNASGTKNYWDGPNSYYKIIDDPTNSGRGKVYFAEVKGPPPDKPQNRGSHRPYPDVYFPFKPGSYSVQFDVWVSSDISPKLRQSEASWLSFVSIFNAAPPWNRDYSLQFLVNLERGPLNKL